MNFNKSPMAFDDVRELFDRALRAPKGVRVPCQTRAAAFTLRSRLNYFRSMDRRENKFIYAEDHQMHGRSVYDRLVLRIPPARTPEEHILYIEPRTLDAITVEEIQ